VQYVYRIIYTIYELYVGGRLHEQCAVNKIREIILESTCVVITNFTLSHEIRGLGKI
jgi:hypothetical protein